MITVRKEDVIHKVNLIRLLTEISDHSLLPHQIFFKGGTCASMMGILDRFSVDLDFDLGEDVKSSDVRNSLKQVFKKLEFEIDFESKTNLLFKLKYNSRETNRNSLKLSVVDFQIKSNIYQPAYLPEISRVLVCQSVGTIVANKLVAPIDRYNTHKTIAGRDIYDIHHFLINNLEINTAVIIERTKMEYQKFLSNLYNFIKTKITQKIIDEDLNLLLPAENFTKIRKTLISETLLALESQINN